MNSASAAAETRLSGIAAQAIAAAWPFFAQEGGAAAHYNVIVVPHADACEVIFLPNADPGHSSRGGATRAGRELHYFFASDGRVLRHHYAR